MLSANRTAVLELDECEAPPLRAAAPWHAVWTRSHSEQLVADQLAGKGYRIFLPKMNIWSRRAGQRHVIQVPMFSGYLFLNEAVDKETYIEVHKARGVVGILGERWDRLAPIAGCEMQALRQAVDAQLTIAPYPYLKKGQRVRIIEGPLKDVEGFFVENSQKKGLLVLSVGLLQRSVAVQIDPGGVVPA